MMNNLDVKEPKRSYSCPCLQVVSVGAAEGLMQTSMTGGHASASEEQRWDSPTYYGSGHASASEEGSWGVPTGSGGGHAAAGEESSW